MAVWVRAPGEARTMTAQRFPGAFGSFGAFRLGETGTVLVGRRNLLFLAPTLAFGEDRIWSFCPDTSPPADGRVEARKRAAIIWQILRGSLPH
jgi:hypothetical protein